MILPRPWLHDGDACGRWAVSLLQNAYVRMLPASINWKGTHLRIARTLRKVTWRAESSTALR